MSNIQKAFKNADDEKGFIRILRRYWQGWVRRFGYYEKCNFLALVEDSGQKEHEHLFDKYFKLDDSAYDWQYGNNSLQGLIEEWEQERINKKNKR